METATHISSGHELFKFQDFEDMVFDNWPEKSRVVGMTPII